MTEVAASISVVFFRKKKETYKSLVIFICNKSEVCSQCRLMMTYDKCKVQIFCWQIAKKRHYATLKKTRSTNQSSATTFPQVLLEKLDGPQQQGGSDIPCKPRKLHNSRTDCWFICSKWSSIFFRSWKSVFLVMTLYLFQFSTVDGRNPEQTTWDV